MSSIEVNNSYGQQTSIPQEMQSAESAAALSIADAAAAIGEQQYSWAQQQYATTSAMTDQAVTQYLNFANEAQGMATNAINTYEQMYQPQEQAAVQQANTYASAPRIALNMGAAQSDAAQASNAARIAAESNLESYGIDPSSGRYQELEQAQRAGGAAAAAGAGQQAMLATQNTGLQLRQQAINTGLQYPGFAVNELNAANTGVSNAENAVLSNVNTGVNALESANPFLSTAMQLRYPPVANQSQGTQSSMGSSIKQAQPSGNGGNSGNTAGSKGANPNSPSQNLGSGNGGGGGGGGNVPSTPLIPVQNPGNNGSADVKQVPSGGAGGYGGGYIPQDTGPLGDMGIYNQGGLQPSYNTDTQIDPFANPTQYGDVNQAPDLSAPGIPDISTYQPSYDTANISNPWGDTSGGGSYVPPASVGGSYVPPAPVDNSFDTGAAPIDYSNMGNYVPQNTGGGGGGGGYARGGAIPTPGGQVPLRASPSLGRRTDDVNASLTPHEFVVPQDVALWKGQEFFQKLIAQSRRARMTAPAHGKPGTPQPGPARFVSRPMARPMLRPMPRPMMQAGIR